VLEYELSQVTPPSAAVTTDEAKAACRVLHDDEDVYFDQLIAAATDIFDGPWGFLGQCIVTQTWKITLPASAVQGSAKLVIDHGPISSIAAIATFDGTTETELTVGDFDIIKGRFSTSIEPKSGSWPTLEARDDALRIEFVAGDAEARPRVKQAILMTVAHWYANRESVVVGSITKEIEMGPMALLANDRRFY